MRTQLLLASIVTALGMWAMFWSIASAAMLYALSSLPVAPAPDAPTFVLEEVVVDTEAANGTNMCAAVQATPREASSGPADDPRGTMGAGRRANAPRRGRPPRQKRF